MYTCHLYIEKGPFSNFTSTVTIEKVSGSAPCSPCLIAGSVCCLPLCFVANGMGNCPVRSARYKRQARTLHIESTVWWPDCKILYIVIVALFGHWIVAFSTPAIWIDAHQPVEVRRMAIRTFWMVIHFSAASIERNEVSTTASIVPLIASKEIEKKIDRRGCHGARSFSCQCKNITTPRELRVHAWSPPHFKQFWKHQAGSRAGRGKKESLSSSGSLADYGNMWREREREGENKQSHNALTRSLIIANECFIRRFTRIVWSVYSFRCILLLKMSRWFCFIAPWARTVSKHEARIGKFGRDRIGKLFILEARHEEGLANFLSFVLTF